MLDLAEIQSIAQSYSPQELFAAPEQNPCNRVDNCVKSLTKDYAFPEAEFKCSKTLSGYPRLQAERCCQ